MTIKNTPTTSLPWRRFPGMADCMASDRLYMLHAANAYPKLVEALREMDRVSEAFDVGTEKGRKALADAILPAGNWARDLLRSLGENA